MTVLEKGLTPPAIANGLPVSESASFVPCSNAFTRLKVQRLTTAHKPFLARGITVKRCSHCQLARSYCICRWLQPFDGDPELDVVLLMHRDEILKPTNTGRLIANAFPQHCKAFEWSRLAPPSDLLKILTDPSRQCAVVYPASEQRKVLAVDSMSDMTPTISQSQRLPEIAKQKTLLTVILLDGTWRQAARMMNHSQWLQSVPVLPLSDVEQAEYKMRKATEDKRLATAEAGVALLQQLGRDKAAHHLKQLFQVFNYHYSASRACTRVTMSESHRYFEQLPV